MLDIEENNENILEDIKLDKKREDPKPIAKEEIKPTAKIEYKNPIYILGSGASLTGFDFSKLDGKKVICCNHSFKFVKNPLHVIYIDRKFIRELSSDDMDKLTKLGQKVYSPDPYYNGMRGQFKGYTGALTQTDDFNKVLKINSSGHSAISLALKYKPDVIYLLGFDYKVLTIKELQESYKENTGEEYKSTKELVHFSDETENHNVKLGKDFSYHRANNLYEQKIKAFNMYMSYNIVNLSKHSALNQFKKESLRNHFGGN
jgi:hypothetical protein